MTSSYPHLTNTRFDLIKKHIGEENFNFLEFLQIHYPCIPKYHIEMHNFQFDVLRNCVIDNLFDQGLSLETETSRLLVDFLTNDFNDISKKIYLQVLILYSKMNVQAFYERYHSTRGKPTQARLFNGLINSYLTKALMPVDGINETVPASREMKEFVVTSLLSDAILQAFQSCLKDCLGFTSSIEWIKEQISSMKIYTVEDFVPLIGFRGACLTDGLVIICIRNLAGSPDSEKRQADLINLVCHECGHYLARVSCNDFNFASPFKLLSDQCNVRKDVVDSKLNFEIGRSVELYLFDKMQPNWLLSSKHAAIQFLDRLKTYKTYPIIKNEEFKDLGLVCRDYTSPTFGIEIMEYHDFF